MIDFVLLLLLLLFLGEGFFLIYTIVLNSVSAAQRHAHKEYYCNESYVYE